MLTIARDAGGGVIEPEVDPGATNEVAVCMAYSLPEFFSATAVMQARITRVTNGTTPTAQTPETTNTLAAALQSAAVRTWSTSPTDVGNPLVVWGTPTGATGINPLPFRVWRPTNPSYPIIEQPSGRIELKQGATHKNNTCCIGFEEQLGRFPQRRGSRGRRAGYSVYQGHAMRKADANPGMVQTGAISFLQPLDWPASVQNILAFLLDDAVTTPVASIGVGIEFEALAGVAAATPEAFESARGVAAPQSDPFEGVQGGIAASSLTSLEALRALAQIAGDAYEATGGIASTGANPFEAVKAIVVTGSDPLEAAQAVATSGTDPLESNTSLSTSVAVPLEALAGIVASRADLLEALAGVASVSSAPLEALGAALIAVSQTSQAPFEATQGIVRALGIPLEALAGLAATAADPFESVTAVLLTSSAAFESLAPVAKTVTVPFESFRGVAQVSIVLLEALQEVVATSSDPLEAFVLLGPGTLGAFDDPHTRPNPARGSDRTGAFDHDGPDAGTAPAVLVVRVFDPPNPRRA